MPKIIAFAGSIREESFNWKLLQIAANGARQADADVTVVNLADYPMPLFNQDLEASEGMPDTARRLKQLMIESDGLLIASPEYNSAFSPLLKNTIDWISRAEDSDEPPLAAYKGKVAAILSASPGPLGGLRGLVFLRMLLGNLGVTVLPNQQTLPSAFNAFSEDGNLLDQKKQQAITELGAELASTLCSLGQGLAR